MKERVEQNWLMGHASRCQREGPWFLSLDYPILFSGSIVLVTLLSQKQKEKDIRELVTILNRRRTINHFLKI